MFLNSRIFPFVLERRKSDCFELIPQMDYMTPVISPWPIPLHSTPSRSHILANLRGLAEDVTESHPRLPLQSHLLHDPIVSASLVHS